LALLAHLAGRGLVRRPELVFLDELERGEELQIMLGKR
jgi:hypothetical protein